MVATVAGLTVAMVADLIFEGAFVRRVRLVNLTFLEVCSE